MYIVLYSATMLMIGPSTFLEDEEDEDEDVSASYWVGLFRPNV